MIKSVIKSVVGNTGNAITGKSSGSWSSYWATQTNFYGKGRSVLTIPDDHGNDASILLPYYYKPVGNEYLGWTDPSNILSIGATDFTFAMWVKGEGINTVASTDFLGGKMESSYIVTGTYGFDADGTTGKYRAFLRTSSNYILNESNISVLDSQWHFLLMEIDQTDHVLRFWIDNNKIGNDVAIIGTLAAAARAFCIGCGTVNAGGALGSHISKTSHSDTYVYQKKLTPTEKTSLFNREIVAGATAHWCLDTLRMWPYDSSGNGYQMNRSVNSAEANNIRYSAYGTRQGLNLGYDLYQKVASIDIYGVFLDNGTSRPAIDDVTYKLSETFPAFTDYHNFYDSFIEFTGDQWDRSDTTIYNALARSGYYDASNPKRWQVAELNEFILRTYYNTGYENMCFSKITNDGTFDSKLNEIFSFATNLTASQLLTIQNYIGKVPTISTVTDFENATWERHPSRGATKINYNPVIQRATQVWKTDACYYSNIMIDPLNTAQLVNIYGGPAVYYTTHAIGRATAPLTNLHKWTDYASNPILEKGAGGTWDEGVIMPACMLWNPDDSKFWLYYAGYDATFGTDTHLGLAQSSDGLTWTKYAGNPILDPSGAETCVGDNAQILREGSNWYMIYNYREGADILPGIRWATSTDGLTWVKGAGELLTRNATYAKTFIEGMRWFKIGSKYCIFYGSYNADTDIWSSSLATSDSPTSGYTNSALNPLFSESSGGWDSSFTATTVPFLINGKWIFQYQSTDDTTVYGTANYHMGAGQLFKKIV